MAVAKKKELAQMSVNDLRSKYGDLKKELMKLQMQSASGTPPENPGLVKATRKAIARIHTYITQKSMVKQVSNETPKKEIKAVKKVAKKSSSKKSTKKEVEKKK